MIKISGYQLPYNYGDNDRYYKSGGVVNLPPAVFEKIITDNTREISFSPINITTAYLNIKGNLNCNYIKVEGIEHNDATVSYWFIINTDTLTTGAGTYKHTLKYDVLTSMELIKNTNTKTKIQLERKIYNSYQKKNDKLILKDERNPKVWNNKEFDGVIPQNKTVKPFSLSPLLEKTESTFQNGSVVYKVPERYKNVNLTFRTQWGQFSNSGSCWGVNHWEYGNYTIKLSPVISIVNEIIKTFNYKDEGGELSAIATMSTPYVNTELNVYNATSLSPVVYETLISTTSGGTTTPSDTKTGELASNNQYVNVLNSVIETGGSYQCEWGHTVRYNDPNFVLLLRRILVALKKNDVDRLGANTNLININAATHWLIDLPYEISGGTIEAQKVLPYTPNILGVKNCYLDSEPAGVYKIPIDLDRKLEKEKTKIDVIDKIEIDIDNKLFTDWDVYKKLTPQLFNDYYNPLYINLAGGELPLDKSTLLKNGSLYLETWLGSGEQNISLYTGKLGTKNEILEPRFVSKYGFSQPLEFSKDVSSQTYQLKKNYYDAKLSETSLAKNRDVSQITQALNSKITASNNLTDAQLELNQGNLRIGIEARKRGLFNNIIGAAGTGIAAGIFTGGNVAIGIGAGIGAAVKGGLGNRNSNITDIARTGIQNVNTARRNEITKAALQGEALAQIGRVENDAVIKRSLINAEISDIHNIPNQNINSSVITKMLSMEKGQVSLIELETNEKQQKAMWEFWNTHGLETWGDYHFSTDWYKQNTLFDYFKGGDWTKYLNSIGVYNIEIIEEFNNIVKTGLRLHHQEYQLGNMLSKSDISTPTPNWNREIVKTILPST